SFQHGVARSYSATEVANLNLGTECIYIPISLFMKERKMMIMSTKAPSSSKCFSFFFFVIFFVAFSISNAQTQNATTDPSEVRALNSIFQQWETQAPDTWNISGEPCSGRALSDSDSVFEDSSNNPAIRCDCSFEKGTICHITRLRVFSLEKRGQIPEELLALRFLTFLKIDQNFFTGPLPAFIGNMSRLALLSVAQNSLSGPIPKEIGNLKELYMLSLGINNFSGTLPPELGNLVELQQLCGFTGEIPSTFANLRNLQIVYASDNALTGKIPDFIGNNWTKLASLKLEGNSFEGPIPSNIGNLTSLTILRISGIYNGSSSLDFVRNLKNIADLVLRNVLLTGSIPTDIVEFQSLQKLDLSFNNLTGQIPSELFNMNSLTFLGNNSLSGTLPSQKSQSLKNMNVVANNFTLNSSDIRLLPGLQCLQRDANFAIKCGGPQMTADGILFEAENSTLGAATFNVTSTQKWAVSNVGLYEDRENPLYVQNTFAQVKSTNTPAIYQTSRISPVSLRYYGLGLENGPYTVNLFFAETAYPERSTQSWKSLGRRVFDIYIQQLSVASHQGKSQFIAEVATISAVQHRNLVKLYGCCIEGKRHLLVYEYLENKSLDQALFGRSDLHLDWATRFNICLATARGLAYLHEESRPRIVHRDVKASNILLDAELCPKISDFGLAKLYDDKKTHISTRVAGTIGYLAPEYAMRGHLTEKADVFGFGIVALEILSGRPNTDNSLKDDKIYLLEWAWALHENNQSLDLVDPNLVGSDENEALRVMGVALLCTQGSPTMRPPMSRVVAMLAGDIEVSGVITKPSYLTDWDFKDLTGSFMTEDTQNSIATENTAPNLSSVNVTEFSDIIEGR
ncbi:Serine-threonine/tyrosine-protein kinase, partial [Theobroma cacao]